MGEYAHYQMRDEIKGRHGFDIGDYDDSPPVRFKKPVHKRVKCPHCDCRPKEAGVTQHIRDKHGVELAVQYELKRL